MIKSGFFSASDRQLISTFGPYLNLAILEALEDGIIMVRARDGMIVYASRQFEQLLGYTEGELIGKHISLINAPTQLSPEQVADSIMSAVRMAGRWHGEVHNLKKDGDKIWTYISVTTFEHPKHGKIELAVQKDITERKVAEAQKARDLEWVQQLLHHIVHVQEVEKDRISAELHDTVGQRLGALGIELEYLRRNISVNNSIVSSTIDDMSKAINELMECIRATISDMRPRVLDDYGLSAAIEWYAQDISRRSDLSIDCQLDPTLKRASTEIELALFRIMQEAVMNIIKHSSAKQVQISLKTMGKALQLTVQDNGLGFIKQRGARAAHRGGWGLSIMRERAEAVGGALKIEFPNQGTHVIAEVPYDN